MREPLELDAVLEVIAGVLSERKVPHAFIGALAAIAWGRTRATTDIDVVALVAREELAGIEAALAGRGFRRGADVGAASDPGGLPDIAIFWSPHAAPIRLDLFVAKLEFEREVVARALQVTVLGRAIPVAAPEASIVYKLLASRHKDLEDVVNVFEARQLAGKALDWEFLDRWAAEWEISDRLAPYRARFGPPS